MSRRLRRWLWLTGWPARSVLVILLRGYQFTLGRVIGGGCRFHPSCSAYAIDAIRNCGAVRGAGLASWRVLRCSPLSSGGVDYPPARPSLYDTAIQRATGINGRGASGVEAAA